MAYDSVRAQLDKLLGPDRNGPLTAPNSAPVSYTDPAVCKHFLLGFCPNDLSIKHRSEPGSCPRQHPSAARAAFEADRAAGKVTSEVSLWTRELLAECRAILSDEERRIRGNARRLQETYNAKGNLHGLMIKNFDTLKALGMVRKDAKIRILSEMEDGGDLLPADNFEPENDPAEEETDAEIRPLEVGTKDDKSKAKIMTGLEGAGTAETVSGLQNERGIGNSETAADDDENDLEGFGVIKVIPAPDKKPPMDNTEKHNDAPPRDDADQTYQQKDAKDNDRSTVPTLSEAKAKEPTDEGSAQVRGAIEKESKDDNHKQANDLATSKPGEEKSAEGDAAIPAPHSEIEPEEDEDKMEEFYRRGTGPDGLLMLDRKQSKRVCALCGGYISLVDAESRLLSHYGGKSHHSLVQLREKVAELEKEVATYRSFGEPVAGRDYQRVRRDYRENRWSRGEERGPRGWDRYRGRNDREQDRRGYGTTDWYSGSYRGRDQRARDADRRSGEDYYRRERDSGRYGSGRKRYRSRSPNRSSRRSRYRY